MRTLRKLAPVVAAASLAAVVSGCSGSPDTVASAPVPTPTGTSDRAAAEQALAAAVETIRTEPATAFMARTQTRGLDIDRVTGVDLATGGWRATATFPFSDSPSGGPVVMHVRSTAGSTYMQMETWPVEQRKCWVVMGPNKVPIGMQAMLPDEPAYVTLPGHITALGFADDSRTELRGDVDLGSALYLLTATVVDELDVPPAATGRRVPVTMTMKDGRLTRIKLSGQDMAAALVAGGAGKKAVRELVAPLEFRLTYSEGDADEVVEAPAARLVHKGTGATPPKACT